jgi:hypothetical protein
LVFEFFLLASPVNLFSGVLLLPLWVGLWFSQEICFCGCKKAQIPSFLYKYFLHWVSSLAAISLQIIEADPSLPILLCCWICSSSQRESHPLELAVLDWTASFCETVFGVEELETVARKDGVAVSNSSEFLLSTSIDDPV